MLLVGHSLEEWATQNRKLVGPNGCFPWQPRQAADEQDMFFLVLISHEDKNSRMFLPATSPQRGYLSTEGDDMAMHRTSTEAMIHAVVLPKSLYWLFGLTIDCLH